MTIIEIFQFSYGSDNYGFLVHNKVNGETACVDAGDDKAVFDALAEKGWTLSQLWITHHHWDHTDGLKSIKEKTGCTVYGPIEKSAPIAGLDHQLGDGDQFKFGDLTVDILHTPGHTTDMINFYLASENVVFTGDTLFVMGCGRIFEGNPDMMWQSLSKLMMLPKETEIHCAHEYTLANANFALTVDPDNKALNARRDEVVKLRGASQSTVPTTLEKELQTNPFLRADSVGIRKTLGMENASDAEVFAEVRARKDRG